MVSNFATEASPRPLTPSSPRALLSEILMDRQDPVRDHCSFNGSQAANTMSDHQTACATSQEDQSPKTKKRKGPFGKQDCLSGRQDPQDFVATPILHNEANKVYQPTITSLFFAQCQQQDPPFSHSGTASLASTSSDGGSKRPKLDGSQSSDKATSSDQDYDGNIDDVDKTIRHTMMSRSQSASNISGSVSMAAFPSPSSTKTASSHSRQKVYKCPYPGCDNAYTKPSRLAEHERAHTDERPYNCPAVGCKASFRREDHLKIHVKSHDSTRAFKCIQHGCEKAYYTKDKLTRHLKTHGEIVAIAARSRAATPTPTASASPLVARRTRSSSLPAIPSYIEINRERYGTRREYDQESETPSLDDDTIQRVSEQIEKERPYACTFEGCFKRFTKHQKLKSHVCMDHEGRKPYPCAEENCKMSFNTPSKLRKHQSVHSGTRRYACGFPGCNVIFTKWSELQNHNQKNHKSMSCSVCGKVVLRSVLKSHIKTHDVERPVVPCPFEGCNRVYSTQRTLDVHLQTTHNRTPGSPRFKCEYEGCGMGFEFKHVRDKHVLRIHVKPQPRKKRSDAIEYSPLDEMVGFTEQDAVEKLPFVCNIPGCVRRYMNERLLRRHLNSAAHTGRNEDEEITGQDMIQSLDEVENRTIRDMIEMSLDSYDQGDTTSP